MISRRRFLTGAAITLAPMGAAAHAQEYKAQQAGKVYRIGLLLYTAACDRAFVMAPFRDGLRAAGYVGGQNIVIDCRGGVQARDRLDDLGAELARLKVDVLIAEGTIGTLAAKRATSAIPIVMVYVADPVGSGLVASLARPGGNVTGLSVLFPGVVQKTLQILKEIAPRVSRMAVWMDATNPGQTHLDAELDAAAKLLGITLQRTDIRSAAGLDWASTAALAQRVQALFVYPLPIGIPDRQRIAEFGIKNRLPTVGITPPYIEAGMLVAYGVSPPDQYRRLGAFIDKILRGAKPADIPVEQPTKFELVVNLKTAKALGLTIPPSLLARADQVIE